MSFRYINNPSLSEKNEEQKSMYDKWRSRQFGKRIPIHIFGSSSEGNSVYLKPYKMLIDVGLPYKVYMEYNPQFFLDVDYIVVTHHHGDHLNASTLLRILDNHPHIRLIVGDFFWQMITSDHYKKKHIPRDKGEVVPLFHDANYKTDDNGDLLLAPSELAPKFQKHYSKVLFARDMELTTHDGRKFLFEPLTVKHGDIANVAIQLKDETLDFDFLYASDLDNLNGERSFTDMFGVTQYVTGLNQNRLYTCMFIEANYDEDLLKTYYSMLDPSDPDYSHKKARADGNIRHISEQETFRYLEKHLAEGGLFVPLHASKTFGTLHQ